MTTTEQISEGINKYLHSEDFLSWAEEKAMPIVLPKMEEFAKANAHKAQEYIDNPELLEKDFESFAGWMNKADWLLAILDVAIIIKMVTAALLTAIPTAGGSLVGLLAGLGGRQLIKAGLKTAAHIVLRRLIRKLSVRAFKKYAVAGGLKVAGAFAREFAFRYVLYNCFSLLFSAVKVGGAGTLIAAQYVLSKYGSEIGVSSEVIGKLTDTTITSEFFLSVLQNQMEGVTDHLENMLSLQGLQKTSIGAVARLLGVNHSRRLLHFSEGFQTLNRGLQTGQVSGKALRVALEKSKAEVKKIEEAVVGSEDEKLSSKEILEILNQEKVPEFFHQNYLINLKRLLAREATDDKQRKINIIKEHIEKKRGIYPILEENFTEFATLSFLLQYEQFFQNKKSEMEELLRDAIDIDVVSIEGLMAQAKASSFREMLDKFRQGKILQITGVIDRLTFGDSTSEEKIKFFQEFIKIYQVERYKQSLFQLIFKKSE